MINQFALIQNQGSKWKDVKLRGWHLSLSRVKSHEIKSLKSIRDAIKRNEKTND
jgi:hypothetical protein